MFKIAFPWATHAEEKEERDYLKSLTSTSQDEIAGNVWIAPEFGKRTCQLSRWSITDAVGQLSNLLKTTV